MTEKAFRKRVLFVNSTQMQCGCYSYGERSFNILSRSQKYNFIYGRPENKTDYEKLLVEWAPHAVIYNYHPLTMSWLNFFPNVGTKHMVLHHEGSMPSYLHPYCWLNVDSTIPDSPDEYSIPRPIIETPVSHASNKIPVIGSFGMSFGNKGFGRIVKMVNDQFDEAVIRLHMPRAYYGDRNGEARAEVIPGCFNEMRKPAIKLEISDVWLDDDSLLMFLSENDLNIFLYDEMVGRGLSSVIDYALSVDTPLAINDSFMFRHIQRPEINVANKTLQEIINQGVEPLKEFRELWSNKNFLEKYESILDQTV